MEKQYIKEWLKLQKQVDNGYHLSTDDINKLVKLNDKVLTQMKKSINYMINQFNYTPEYKIQNLLTIL